MAPKDGGHLLELSVICQRPSWNLAWKASRCLAMYPSCHRHQLYMDAQMSGPWPLRFPRFSKVGELRMQGSAKNIAGSKVKLKRSPFKTDTSQRVMLFDYAGLCPHKDGRQLNHCVIGLDVYISFWNAYEAQKPRIWELLLGQSCSDLSLL